MKGKYDYDVIRDYLHGLLDQETARRIRDLIRQDDVARNIAAGILQLEHEFKGEEHEVDAYIEQLRQKQLTLIHDQGKTEKPSRGWIKLAAAILIAASGSALWLMVFQSDQNELLSSELNQPYPLAVLDRTQSNKSATNVAFEFYINGEYKNAVDAFGKIANDTNDVVTVTFYHGLSNLYAGEYDRAITLLGSKTIEGSRYREQALWFQSLALIKAGRNDEARNGLEQIGKDPGHYKSAVALQLLEQLD